MALYEGRFGVRETFSPVVFNRLVGLADRVIPGTALYVTVSTLLLYAALYLLARLRPRTSPWVFVSILAMTASPTFLLFQGVVWKDVLFANLAVAGFTALAWALNFWERPRVRWPALVAACGLLAVAMAVRQNGLVVVTGAAGGLALGLRSLSWTKRLAWGAGLLATSLIVSALLGQVAQPRGASPDKGFDVGLRILQHYDVVAVAARSPDETLQVIAASRPAAAAFIKTHAAEAYSPERVDRFDEVPGLAPALWKTPTPMMCAQWLEVATRRPEAYFAHRSAVFREVFLTPHLDRCLPVFVGADGPRNRMQSLAVPPRLDAKDRTLSRYAHAFIPSPAYSHAFFAGVAAVCGLLALRRGRPGDVAVAALMGSALAFAASFFAISIACDYRYLYMLDLAATVGIFHLALDPSGLIAAGRGRGVAVQRLASGAQDA